jgi:hypothetical protein
MVRKSFQADQRMLKQRVGHQEEMERPPPGRMARIFLDQDYVPGLKELLFKSSSSF